jgi:DNA polymerase delta subunit 1
LDVWFSDLQVHAPVGEWLKIAPRRLLAFDIECTSDGHMPHPRKQPVIMIASIIDDTDTNGKITRRGYTFALDTYEQLEDVPDGIEWTLYECKTEKDMLSQWRDFVSQTDPDGLLGHNIKNFDIWYLIERADFLGNVSNIQ